MSMKKAGLFVLPLTLFAFGQAQAELVTVEVSALVDDVYDPGSALEGTLSPGDVITGTYTYETGTPDALAADPSFGDYAHPVGSPVGFELTAGPLNFTYDPAVTDFGIGIANFPDFDAYHIRNTGLSPLANGAYVDNIYVDLMDPTATATDSDVLPTAAPDLAKYQDRGLFIGGRHSNGTDYYHIGATVTSVSSAGQPVASSVVTYKILAEITDVYDTDNLLGGIFVPGDAVTGTYTVDTGAPDLSPDDEMVGIYQQPSDQGLGFDLTLNGVALRSVSGQSEVNAWIESFPGGHDQFSIHSSYNETLPNGVPVQLIELGAIDIEGTALDSDALTADVPVAPGYDDTFFLFEGHSADGLSAYQVRGKLIAVEIDDGTVFEVSPPAATYDRYQDFALALIFDAGATPGAISGTLNGADITPYIQSECHPGAPNLQQRFTLVCPHFSGTLGTGGNDLELTVDVDGELHTEAVSYEVIGY